MAKSRQNSIIRKQLVFHKIFSINISMRRFLVFILLTAISGTRSFANEPNFPDFVPSEFKLDKERTSQVAVLGSPHLSQLPKSFDPSKLNLLLDKLTEWKPQMIAIESLSGLQCAYLKSYQQRYNETIQAYCPDTSAAQIATGLDVVTANVQMERVLQTWPQSPSPSQRRNLAALFMAAGEPASALVQWLRLPLEERVPSDGLSAELIEKLNGMLGRHDEGYLVAAPLAARIGLERIYAMDDHTADMPISDEVAYGNAMVKAWNNPSTMALKKFGEELKNHVDTSVGVLTMYRSYNERSRARLVFNSDMRAALEEPSAQHFGRAYVAYWENRNLRMASNIREAITPANTRALVIVGASHKAYLEAYLNQMHDIQIAPTNEILK